MKANDTQVGGLHYRTGYQHWDFVIEHLENRYLEGQITKYVTRWRRKNGLQDLMKASHFLVKLIEAVQMRRVHPIGSRFVHAGRGVRAFIADNRLDPNEAQLVRLLASWESLDELREAQGVLGVLLEDAQRHERRLDAIKAGASPDAEPGAGYVNQDR
jgi:hypothetical protein